MTYITIEAGKYAVHLSFGISFTNAMNTLDAGFTVEPVSRDEEWDFLIVKQNGNRLAVLGFRHSQLVSAYHPDNSPIVTVKQK